MIIIMKPNQHDQPWNKTENVCVKLTQLSTVNYNYLSKYDVCIIQSQACTVLTMLV